MSVSNVKSQLEGSSQEGSLGRAELARSKDCPGAALVHQSGDSLQQVVWVDKLPELGINLLPRCQLYRLGCLWIGCPRVSCRRAGSQLGQRGSLCPLGSDLRFKLSLDPTVFLLMQAAVLSPLLVPNNEAIK